MPERAQWTVLSYIAAHNNLAQYGEVSLREILAVGSSAEVVHGALYDRHDGAARYVMDAPGTVREQELLGRFNSGDPDALIETASWLFGKYPAERYGLVLWSHGTGWEPAEISRVAEEARPGAAAAAPEATERAASPGALVLFRSTLRALQQPASRAERAVLFDDGTGRSLDTLELARVARELADAVGQPLDLLGMDACLMASAEVACELQGAVRCLVASPEMVPGHSWPYQDIYGALRAQPALGGRELAQEVVAKYVAFYTASPPPAGDVTKVALDIDRADELTAPVAALAGALRADLATHAPLLWEVQHAALERETRQRTRTPNKFQHHLWDLGAVAAGLAAAPAAAPAVRDAARAVAAALRPGAGAVLAEGHRGDWFDGTGGVSIYLVPPGQQRLSPAYSSLSFCRATGWHELLAAYHEQLS